jgi:thioredoxin 1
MAIEQIKDADFQQSVVEGSKSQPVIVDFWAEWCGPCKALGPILENVALEFEGKIAVKKINIDENPEAPANYGIRSIPTIIMFKEGSVADTKIGLSSETDLKNWLNTHLS